VLAVSTLEPRKNLPALVAAFSELRRRRPELTLAIAGLEGWEREPWRPDGVRCSDSSRTDVLARLYRGASAFAYPARLRGLRDAGVEALASGVPAVVSSHPSLDEACGDARAACRSRRCRARSPTRSSRRWLRPRAGRRRARRPASRGGPAARRARGLPRLTRVPEGGHGRLGARADAGGHARTSARCSRRSEAETVDVRATPSAARLARWCPVRDVGWYLAPAARARRDRRRRAALPTQRAPARSRVPLVVTIHDLAVLRHPETFNRWTREYSRGCCLGWRVRGGG
jgi:hypothetical protein